MLLMCVISKNLPNSIKSETVFSRRNEELQHSSYNTSKTSISVSIEIVWPTRPPWTGPPINRLSSWRNFPPMPTTCLKWSFSDLYIFIIVNTIIYLITIIITNVWKSFWHNIRRRMTIKILRRIWHVSLLIKLFLTTIYSGHFHYHY